MSLTGGYFCKLIYICYLPVEKTVGKKVGSFYMLTMEYINPEELDIPCIELVIFHT